MIELSDDLFLAEGARRICYLHPEDANKGIKINKTTGNGAVDHNILELNAYLCVADKLGAYVVQYDRELVKTSKGPGLSFELLRDDDGSVSKSLGDYIGSNAVSCGLKRQMDEFFEALFCMGLYFYDFNTSNFAVQRKGGECFLKYTDLKTFNRSKAFIKLEMLAPLFARRKMMRRMIRFYEQVGA